MLHIVTFVTLSLLWLHLLGMGLLAHRFLRPYALARVSAPILATVVLFFLEHFEGFGTLGWPWLLTTPLCAATVYYQRQVLRDNAFIEIAAGLGFLFALAWRWTFPDIDGTVERLSDLSFVANYFPGTTLPPVDTWFPPYKFDFYYSLQHYAAALAGRWFGLDIGTATNLSSCILVSLTTTAAAATGRAFGLSISHTLLLTMAFVVGGSGASILGHFMVDSPNTWFGMRFIGDLHEVSQVSTDFGRWFVSHAYSNTPSGTKPMVLPIETLGFVTHIGEFHSTLTSFLILALKLYTIAILESEPDNRGAQAILAATLPVCLLASVWILPIQTLILAAWIVYRYCTKRPPDWYVIIGANALGLLLAYPHLRAFGPQSIYFDTHFGIVPAGEHTPLLAGLALLWPFFLILLLSLLNLRQTRLGILMTLIWVSLGILSEVIYLEDAYGGEFNRFNTTLKWWPHIYAGALLSLGAINLASHKRLVRYGSTLTLALVSSYIYDLGHDWVNAPKPNKGRLDGAAWITQDLTQKAILDYLKAAEPGTVLERVPQASYTYAPSIALFSGHPALLGWWNGHEALWRGGRNDIGELYERMTQFYAGQLAESHDWLLANDVKYVVWLKDDNKEPHAAFKAVDDQIKPSYDWHEFHAADKIRVGLWVRRVTPAGRSTQRTGVGETTR